MTEPLILAVDLGTSGVKVALITVSGKVLGWEAEPIRLLVTPDGGAEQSPDEWWGAFLSAAGRLLEREQDTGRRVEAVCCSTQGEGKFTPCSLYMEPHFFFWFFTSELYV